MASAQTPRAQGPFAGLFGGATTNTQSLDARGSIFAAHQDVIVPDDIDPAQLESMFTRSLTYGGMNGSLVYGYNRSPAQGGSTLSFNAAAGVSSYTENPQFFPWTASADGTATTKLARRVDLSVGGGVTYSPYFTFGTPGGLNDPGQALTPGINFAATEAPTLSNTANLSIIYNISRRANVAANANYYQQRLLDDEEGDAKSFGGGGVFRYEISRNLNFHAGYTRQVSWSSNPDEPNLILNYFDIGLDYGYSKGFTLARRTTAFFSTSSGVATDGQSTRFRLDGSAGINHGLGRTWMASAFYSRSSGLLAGYEGIVFSDSFNATLSGQVAPRLNFSAGYNWSRGELAFEDGTFQSHSANAQLTYGLFKRVGLYVAYGWFAYDDPQSLAIVDVPTNLDRQTLTAGVSLWQPIIQPQRERTPR